MERERFIPAYALCAMAIKALGTKDILFVERGIWEWKLPFYWGTLQFRLGEIQGAKSTMETITRLPVFKTLSEEEQTGIKNNLGIITKAYKELTQKKKTWKKK
jgi:hypothetical protein